MSASFKISIDNPCSEKWAKMSVNANGRFCDSCQKSVIDFTRFSDGDLKAWFIENHGKACGRFIPEQLDRLILNETKFSIKRFRPGLVAASVITFLSFPKLSSAQITKPKTVQTDDLQRKNYNNNIVLSDSIKIIKGRVIDKDDKTPLPGVVLRLGNNLVATSTNAEGKFELRLPSDVTENKFNLLASYIGYKQLNSPINFENDTELNIELCASMEVLGGPEIYYVRSPSIWDRLRQVFGKRIKE